MPNVVQVLLCVLSCVPAFATPWAVGCQAPLSMGFPRQEYCRGLPFRSPGDLPDPGIELASLVSPALAGGWFTTEPPGKPITYTHYYIYDGLPWQLSW